jgi:hypothetical protein
MRMSQRIEIWLVDPTEEGIGTWGTLDRMTNHPEEVGLVENSENGQKSDIKEFEKRALSAMQNHRKEEDR